VLFAAVQPTLELLDIELATELELEMDEELLGAILEDERTEELETTDELLAGCDSGSLLEEQEKSNEA